MFTENQVRHFYVAANPVAPSGNNPTSASNAGAMKLVVNGNEAYFLYKGPSTDGLQRTDLIDKAHVMDVRLTDAADLAHKKKKVEITLATLNGSAAPIVGEDYVLSLYIHNYIANGDDSILVKQAVARAANTTASDLYKALAVSLAKNMKREPAKLVTVTLKGITGEVDGKKAASAISGTATAVVIEEAEQPWRRGAAPQEFVNFDVVPSTVYVSALNDDLQWGTVTDVTAANTAIIPNSKKVADMEWFFMKERADVYGLLGWPNNIDTEYLVDPSNANGYSFLDIHFYYEGNGHSVGHSEKTLTIVGTKANLKTLVGNKATTGQSATAATGLYAFLEGTNVTIKESASW